MTPKLLSQFQKLPWPLRELIRYAPVLTATFIFAYCAVTKPEPQPTVFSNYSEAKVSNSNKTIMLGEAVDITATWCVNVKAEVTTTVFIQKIGNGSAREPEKFISLETQREPGCAPLHLSIPIATRYGPGTYVIQGLETLEFSPEAKSWTSEEFKVVGREAVNDEP